MGLSTWVYFSSTTSYIGKTGDLVLLVVVQDPISRAHHILAPTKEPLRIFQQQDAQPFLAHPAMKSHLLGTNALR